MARKQSHDVPQRHKQITTSQEDNRPLWILETLHVDEESGHSGERRYKAQHRPKADPEGCEGMLIQGKVGLVARQSAIR